MRTGIHSPENALDVAFRSRLRNFRKAAGFRRLFRDIPPVPGAGKTPPVCWTSPNRFAKRRPLAKAFRAGSGRIAQLVEQMTLNHRVPGSSPGAPTKLFKYLAIKTISSPIPMGCWGKQRGNVTAGDFVLCDSVP
jgi:hypothetical protein